MEIGFPARLGSGNSSRQAAISSVANRLGCTAWQTIGSNSALVSPRMPEMGVQGNSGRSRCPRLFPLVAHE